MTRTLREWTTTEERWLQDNAHLTAREVGDVLGRTEMAILTRRSRLGIKRVRRQVLSERECPVLNIKSAEEGAANTRPGLNTAAAKEPRMSSRDPATEQADRPLDHPDNRPAPEPDNWTHVATAARRVIAEAMRKHHGGK